MQKKHFFTLCATVILCVTLLTQNVFAAITYEPDTFDVLCESAYMVNLDLDLPIYAKAENTQLDPASLTKIMTGALVLDTIPEEDLEKVIACDAEIMNDPYWGEMEASWSGFYANQEVSIRNMLNALIIQSGCDMGDVLAKYTATNYMGGDIQTFVDAMNAKAEELGCQNTHFVNTHGLPAEGQYSSAYDMYLITKYALSVPHFQEIADTDVTYVPADGVHYTDKFPIINTNGMVFEGNEYYYEPLIPIKTGTTSNNTKNLVTLASKYGYTYMVVLLGGQDKDEAGNDVNATYRDTINLYEWAFEGFTTKTIVSAGDSSAGVEIPVRLSTAKKFVIAVPESTIDVLIPSNISASDLERSPHIPESLDAPIDKGESVGSMDLLLDGQVLATVNLVSNEKIERSSFLYLMDEIRKFFSLTIVKIGMLALGVLIILYIVYAIKQNAKQKKMLKKASHVKPPKKN